MKKRFWKKQNRIIFAMVLVCMSFLLYGCGEDGRMGQAVGEANCSDDITLDYYIWSDEETYVRKVVEAWNALQGREAVRLYVIPKIGRAHV